MKNITINISLLFIIALNFSWKNLYAQITDTYKLRQTAPATPEGTKFSNYYFTPPISATGSIPIDIPLYEINLDGVKVPISLSYQTTGIRVTDLSGPVGLGWSLNAGGGVYRSINGRPDEYKAGSPSTFLNSLISYPDYFPQNTNLLDHNVQLNLQSLAKNIYDIGQDEYTYNFLSRSGGIFFNDNYALTETTRQNLKFSYDSNQLNTVYAKDDSGNSFKFNDKETTNTWSWSIPSAPPTTPSVYGTTGWKLSEITTVHDRKINFGYVDYSTQYFFPSSSTISRMGGGEAPPSNCYTQQITSSTTFTNMSNENKLISSITSAYVNVSFVYTDNASASIWQKQLDRIVVTNQNGETIKTIRFEYSVFAGDPRLKLSKIYIEDANGAQTDSYSFLYNEHLSMPDCQTMGKDAFGYYNGASNTTLLSAYNVTDFVPSAYSANREVVENFATVGSLKQIVYPTGGGMRIYYDINRFGPRYAPGLRVEKVELFDRDNTVNTKIFEYYDIEGRAITFPDYAMRENTVDPNFYFAPASYNYSSENTVQQTHYPKNFFYKKVLIKEIGIQGDKVTAELYGTPTYNGEPLEQYVYEPMIIAREFYKSDYSPANLVKSETFDYKVELMPDSGMQYKMIPGYLSNIVLAYQGSSVLFGCFDFSLGIEVASVIRSKWVKTSKHTTKEFFANATDLTSEVAYHYDNTNHFYPTRVTTISSSGLATERKNKYPEDMIASGADPNGIYQLMKNKNILNVTILESTETNGKKQESITDYYQPSLNLFVPQAVRSLNSSTASYEVRTNYNHYDVFGNILEQQKTNGVKEVFLWGYNGQYAVAKVVGSDYATVSALIDQNILHVGTETNRQAQLTNLRNHFAGNSAVQVSTFAYKPLVGLTQIIDPKGMLTFFEYDSFQRLQAVKDQQGNVVKGTIYNYRLP